MHHTSKGAQYKSYGKVYLPTAEMASTTLARALRRRLTAGHSESTESLLRRGRFGAARQTSGSHAARNNDSVGASQAFANEAGNALARDADSYRSRMNACAVLK